MVLPDIYGQGALFVYSGLDGESQMSVNFCGTYCGDNIGVCFPSFYAVPELVYIVCGVKDITYRAVTSDWLDFSAKDSNDIIHRCEMFFACQKLILGYGAKCCCPSFTCELPSLLKLNGDTVVYSNNDKFIAFKKIISDDTILFALAFGKSEEEAVSYANKGILTNFEPLRNQKEKFYKIIPDIDADEDIKKLFAKCFSVMKSQVYSPEKCFKSHYTTPNRLPHKYMWFWDSVFHSFGNRLISNSIARETLDAVLDTQQENGFIPHMSSLDWHSSVTQPPMLAWGYLRLYEHSKDAEMLRSVYTRLKNYLIWNENNRDSNKNGLFEWLIENSIHCRCGECGMDNSPRFDGAEIMDCIDFSCFMAKEMLSMQKISEIIGNGEEKYWKESYDYISDAVNRELWDEETGFYYDRNLKTNELVKVKAVSSFLPLFAEICSEERARRLVGHLINEREFASCFMLPSISRDDPDYSSDMWRGPVWINYNYMISQGLDKYGYSELSISILMDTVNELSKWYSRTGTIYEYYDCDGKLQPSLLNRKGKPIVPYNFNIRMQSIRDYGWSCSLCADIIDIIYRIG